MADVFAKVGTVDLRSGAARAGQANGARASLLGAGLVRW
jgi:hypothetical protein